MRAIKIRLGLNGQMFPKCWHCHKWLKIVKHHCKLDTTRMVEFFYVIETVRVSCSHKTKSTHFCPLSLLQKANTTLASPQFTFFRYKILNFPFWIAAWCFEETRYYWHFGNSKHWIDLPSSAFTKDFLVFSTNNILSECFLQRLSFECECKAASA